MLAFEGALRGVSGVPKGVELRQSDTRAGCCQARATCPTEVRTSRTLTLAIGASHAAHFVTNSIAIERLSLVRNVALTASDQPRSFCTDLRAEVEGAPAVKSLHVSSTIETSLSELIPVVCERHHITSPRCPNSIAWTRRLAPISNAGMASHVSCVRSRPRSRKIGRIRRTSSIEASKSRKTIRLGSPSRIATYTFCRCGSNAIPHCEQYCTGPVINARQYRWKNSSILAEPADCK